MITSHQTTIIRRHHLADVWFDPVSQHHSLRAAIAFKRGEVIVKFNAGAVKPYPTYLTIQVGIQQHITLVPEFLQFVNHSCDPSVFFDTDTMELICIRDMEPGDEFNFFYPSTEWEMARPFVCHCGSKGCQQYISGAAKLSRVILNHYRLTQFIQQQLQLNP